MATSKRAPPTWTLDLVNKIKDDCINEGLGPADDIIVLLEAAVIISKIVRPDLNAFTVLRSTLDAIEASNKN